MKDNSFDFIKDKFENSSVNAPDDINEQLVLDKLEGDIPELTVLPPKQSKKKMFAGISAVAAAAVITAGALVFTSVLNQQTVAKPEMKVQHVVAGLRGFSSREEVKDTMRTVLKINESYFGYDLDSRNYDSDETPDDYAVSEGADSEGKVYFNINTTDWQNYKNVYLHLYEHSVEKGYEEIITWGSKTGLMTDEGDGFWSYDFEDNGITLSSDKSYGCSFTADWTAQTCDLIIGPECVGDVAVCTGGIVEDYINPAKTCSEVKWMEAEYNYGNPIIITSTGNIIGNTYWRGEDGYSLFVKYLTDDCVKTNMLFTGKSSQQCIDDTADALGLDIDDVKKAFDESGKTTFDWMAEESSIGKKAANSTNNSDSMSGGSSGGAANNESGSSYEQQSRNYYNGLPLTAGSDAAATHNSTYVQHTGVDEADSAKTNGKYIFYLEDSGYSKNTIAVFSAEGEKTERVAEVSRPENALFIEFYLYGDRVVTVSNVFKDNYYYSSTTQIDVYDASDIKSIKHVDSFFQSGSYVSSRMIGGRIYLVTNDYFIDEDYLPTVGSPETASGDSAVANSVPVENIFSVDTPMNNSFLVISVMDTDKGSRDTATKAIIGSGDDIYCNQQNLYVTALEYSETYYGNLVDYALNNNVVYDDDLYMEKGAQSSSAASSDGEEEFTVDSDGYTVDDDGFYHNDNEGKIYYGAYAPGDEPEPFAQWEPEHTLIIKVSLENGIDFTASGTVEGTVNNQYSLDESGGNLRVATTSYDKEYNETNHLFVLDKNLKQLGSVKDFAKNETIRAVRYINDTAYVITYMETDPLFVIDLSNPSNPQMKGEVKISGFSTMLVPVDDHTLLGIGYHTNDASSEGIDWNTQNALKIVTFDVTDMSSPKVLDTKIFPNCTSEVQYDPKALLVNFERGDYSIPYNYFKDFEYTDGAYRDNEVPEARCGLVNFRVDNGKINVIQDYTSKKFTSQYDTVTRCVYIGDYMYLIGEHYSLLDYYSSDSSGTTGTDSDYYLPSEEISADIEAFAYK